MRIKFAILTFLVPLVAFSQTLYIKGSVLHSKKNELVSTQLATLDSVRAMRGKLGVNPDWVELRKEISYKYPYISADSSISVLKIGYYTKDVPNLEPVLSEFLQQYGKAIPMDELNSYSWAVFLKSNNQKLINELIALFKDRLKNERSSFSLPYWYDTYAGLLYKSGKREEALEQQMHAYSMSSGEELMLDVTNGSILTGAKKADFLITAFKMEKGIPIWEAKDLDSVHTDQKKEMRYWNKLKVRMLPFYDANKADSLIAFTQLQYYKVNKQWDNYASSLVKFVNEYERISTSAQTNARAWDVFLHSSDRKVLKAASDWMMDVIRDNDDPETSMYVDTYANLLYRSGRKKKAIAWQQKAIDIAPEKGKPSLIATLDKMKKDEKTWL